MPFTEDFTAFTSTDDFATSAVFSGNGATVNVIFDKDYLDPLNMESSGPQAAGAEADFPSVVHGQTLTINSIAYSIINVQPDGTGWVVLKLRAP